MGLDDYIIKDSSVWEDKNSSNASNHRQNAIRVGMILECKVIQKTSQVRYIVQVYDKGFQKPISCELGCRFGGVYNYEEYTARGYQQGQDKAGLGPYSLRPGDVVIIAYVNGLSSEGIILTAIKHPARKAKFLNNKVFAYASEFNGLLTTINNDGEHRVTFRGTPTNVAELNKAPTGANIPDPTYNEEVGGSYWEFDKTGSWHINDSSKEKTQFIKIDKPKGTITLTSGTVIIKMEKESEKVTVTCKQMDVTAKDKITMTTKDFSVFAEKTAKIKSKKIAIGTDGVELLDTLIKLIDAIGTLQAISPIGPCTMLQMSATWSQVMKEKKAIESIKGTLS